MKDFESNFIFTNLGKASISHLDGYANRACMDIPVDVFFPITQVGGLRKKAVAVAAAICESCVVKDECLQMALINKEGDGVFGGIDFYTLNTRSRNAISYRNKQ